MDAKARPHTICLVAADVSADQNAGRLATAIRKLAPQVRLIGAGGPAMRGAALDAVVDSSGVSMVGPPDSVRTFGKVFNVWRGLTTLIEQNPPDVAVLIDNETLNMLFARWLKARGIPTVFFFPPQIWFWGRWRLRWIRPISSRVLCAFREEAELYRAAGVDTIWTGHPLRDVVKVKEDPTRAIGAIGLDPRRPTVVLMPGSRRQELKWHCKLMFKVARTLQERDPRLQFALPLATEELRPLIEAEAQQSGLHDLALYVPNSFAVLSQARAVLQCSGTATIETGLLGIPSVIVYQCSRWRYYAARRFMYVKYIGMVNILLHEMVQPEFFHCRLDADQIANELWSLLTDETRRGRIRSRLATLAETMGPPGALEKAARAVLEFVGPQVERHGAQPGRLQDRDREETADEPMIAAK
jgi:lipid-A-disaccharide synthase